MTLGVLSPYRRCGIGSKLLDFVFEKVESIPTVVDVYLNVHVENTEAIEFYKKFDFAITETITGYYRQIDPPDAHVLCKNVVREDK